MKEGEIQDKYKNMHFLFLFSNFATQVYKKSCEYVKSGYGTEKVPNETTRS